MAWPLFMIDDLQEKDRRWEPGATWFVEEYGPGGEHHQFFLDYMAAEEYKQTWAKTRPPICVCLPGRYHWIVDQEASTGGGWTITGEAPGLTAQPSINAVGTYHGWLQNGVLSDDVEGRTFSTNPEKKAILDERREE